MPARLLTYGAAIAALAVTAWIGHSRGWFSSAADDANTTGRRDAAVPVELAAVERGQLVERRVFSGTVQPRAQFTVAPKVAGRITSLHVDIGDEVAPGAVVAMLDDDEFEQAVATAQAELDVAEAESLRAEKALELARRNHDRVTGLREIEIASASELDVALADLDAREAELQVAAARVQRANALLAAARVRKRYATVRATWSGDENPRVVAARYLDEGSTVAANEPLVRVVDIASLRAVLFVTERDFARLRVGQQARVRNDAWPGRTFVGKVDRMAPVFEEASRQMRVEIAIDNEERKLRPGMFVRVEVDLGSADDAVIVPEIALVTRGGGDGVFVVDDDDRARFVAVEVGIRTDHRVQVVGEGITGRVVTLGQQLVEDGTRVRVPPPLDGDGAAPVGPGGDATDAEPNATRE